jgi:uncharacterized protein (DUF58 family)
VRSSGRSRFLSRPRAAGARAVFAWARKRQGEDALPLTLRPRRVYILPTRAGVGAAVLLFVMLLAGLNYSNSLALLLCFMLSGVALVSMHECHRTLVGLKLVAVQVEPAFAGRTGELTLHFTNEDARSRVRLTIRCAPCAATQFELAPGATQAVHACYLGRTRGRQRLERLELATDAPLGLFRAWCWLHLPLEALIYPTPLGSRPLPPPRGGRASGSRRSAPQSGEEDWAWLRPFREGDSTRSVAWKAFAHGAPLLVAHYEAPAGVHRVLDFHPLQSLPLEQRLSQLTQWVLECERRSVLYALALPGCALPARQGPAQRRACLEALALYGLSA